MGYLLYAMCILAADQPATTPKVPSAIAQMHDECNRIRAQHGLPPLKLDTSRCGIGQRWASYLARSGQFRHGGGEQVIAMGYESPQSCMRGWFNSSGHRAWLLSNSSRCGWGAQQSANGTWYWVGVFDGSPQSSGTSNSGTYRRGRLFRR